MSKKYPLFSMLAVILIPPIVIGGTKIKKLDTKTVIEKSVPVIDGRNEHKNIAICPRTSDFGLSTVSLEFVQENDHCPSCSHGVFFSKGDKLVCSYCEIEKVL